MIKVLLANDHTIVGTGLRRIVEESGDEEEQYVVRAIGAGDMGYITKRSSP